MRLAYSTYPLQRIDPLQAVERVRAIGFEGLELNVGDDWPAAPAKLDGDARRRLRDAYAAAGFPSPVLMNLIHLCAPGEATGPKSEALAASCRLARDLRVDDLPPVITTTLGSHGVDWELCRDEVAARLRPYADLAADHGATIAVEAHVGQEFDAPEKAVWLVETLAHEAVRLNFDYSHFKVLSMNLQHCVDLCAPWTVHTHLKDGHMVDGQVRFQLPGDGDLDLDAYFRAVAGAGIDVPVTAEVSAQIWKRDDYDPWDVAGRCYRAMRAAANRLDA